MKECEGCRTKLELPIGKKKYCSRNCRERTLRRNKRGNKSMLAECEMCKKVFLKIRKNHAVCSMDCKNKKYNGLQCAMQKEFREEFPLINNKIT